MSKSIEQMELLKKRGNRLKDHEKLRFLQLHRPLVFNPTYKKLSDGAKIAYAVLSDRQNLSVRNKWVDEEGYIFFMYSDTKLADVLGKKRTTALKYKKELVEHGLLLNVNIEKGKANRLYLLEPEYTDEDIYTKQLNEEEDEILENRSGSDTEIDNDSRQTPPVINMTPPVTNMTGPCQEYDTNKTIYNNTDISNKSVSQERQTDNDTDIILNALKDDIDLYDQEHQDLLVNSIKRLSCKISPTDLLKLSYQHFDYSISKFKAAKKDNAIQNTAAYFDKVLYNSIGELAASLI